MRFDFSDADFAASKLGVEVGEFQCVMRRLGLVPCGMINEIEYYSADAIDAARDFLEKQGVDIPSELRDRDAALPSVPNEQVQDGIFELYRTKPNLAILFELMTDFDEGMQEWRYRHVKLVERTIGEKHGTGGSLGVAFLKKSLFQPIFHDLWAIRHRL